MVAVEKLVPAEVEIGEARHLRPFSNLFRQKAEAPPRRIKRFQAIPDDLCRYCTREVNQTSIGTCCGCFFSSCVSCSLRGSTSAARRACHSTTSTISKPRIVVPFCTVLTRTTSYTRWFRIDQQPTTSAVDLMPPPCSPPFSIG